jgi:hypothetical protein
MKCCSLVSLRTAGPIWLIRFFLMFVIVQIRFSWNKKVEKVARKIGKFGKNLKCFFLWVFVMDMRSFFFVLFVMVGIRQIFRKKNSKQLQRKVEKFGQTAKIIILKALSIITDDRNDIQVSQSCEKAP